jgi:hypothetical protein
MSANQVAEDARTIGCILKILQDDPHAVITVGLVEMTQHVGHRTAKRLLGILADANIIEHPMTQAEILGVVQTVPAVGWRLTYAARSGEIDFEGEQLARGGGGLKMNLPLSQGKVALLDDVDADLTNLVWFADKSGTKLNSCYYARRNGQRIKGRRRQSGIRLHRVVLERVLGRSLGQDERVDHINHDGLDNRRANLRLATPLENSRNRRTQPLNKSSRFKGVSWHKSNKKWQAYIKLNGHNKYLGYFNTEEEAAHAYDVAAKLKFKRFCCLNFPKQNLARGMA